MNTLESYFRWHGRLVATYPVLFLLGTVMTTVMFGMGLISFREESDLTALWVPVGIVLHLIKLQFQTPPRYVRIQAEEQRRVGQTSLPSTDQI